MNDLRYTILPSLVLVLTSVTQGSEPIDIGARRELFVDDRLIERLAGEAELRLHQPTPREIAIVHDAAWEGTASNSHTVFQDGELYRMYYRGWNFWFENRPAVFDVSPREPQQNVRSARIREDPTLVKFFLR